MFWIGTAIFVATYIIIASEKVHKSAVAMGGAYAHASLCFAGSKSW